MALLIIIVVALIGLAFVVNNNDNNKRAKSILNQGGLKSVFSSLHDLVILEGYKLILDNGSKLVYEARHDFSSDEFLILGLSVAGSIDRRYIMTGTIRYPDGEKIETYGYEIRDKKSSIYYLKILKDLTQELEEKGASKN